MHGIILNGLKNFVIESYDKRTWRHICDKADITQRLFIPVTTYPDEQVTALVESAADVSGEDVTDVQRSFGRFIVSVLVDTYGVHIDDEWDGLDLIENVEEHIHKTLRAKRGTTLEPPAIDAQRIDQDAVAVRYTSDRALCGVAKGIIDGVGDHYGEPFEVTEDECMLDGAAECVIVARRKQRAVTDGGQNRVASGDGSDAQSVRPDAKFRDDRSDRPGSDGEHVLQERFGTEDRADGFYESAMQSALTDRMQSFLADRWLGIVGSLDDGRPRAATIVGEPGIVRVIDPETVAWPARGAIGGAPTLDGPAEERWMSLVTVDWWDSTVGLHVNGIGRRVEQLPGNEDDPLPGSDWIVLSIDEAYIHCAKHVPRLSVERMPPAMAERDPIEEPYDRLSDLARRFVGSRLHAFLTTADENGETDVSPRIGPSGFVQVRDESTLAWPEYRGNGVHASLGNMYERPVATLLFADWWSAEAVLEVSGNASLEKEVAWAEDLTDVDRTKTWVVLDVQSVDLVENPPLPGLTVEEFDPPWGTDDATAKKSGYFTE